METDLEPKTLWTLVLAAGQSERFGGIKALAEWDDETLLTHSLKLAHNISSKNVHVVLGGHVKPLIPYLENTSYSENPEWKKGMGTSISWGVQRILEQDENVENILILPIDQPLVTESHLHALIEKSKEEEKNILSESLEEVEGPPAVLHRDSFSRAINLEGPKGLKSFLSEDDYNTVQDALALEDVDTKEDLARLQSLEDIELKPSSTSVFIAGHATKLSLVEIILGSVIHGFNIPFGGNFLSLNQGVFLCRATQHFSSDRKQAAFVPLQVSSVSSILKSLSPAGQKLGPMIAIGMQGLLYSISVLFLGPSRLAQSIGMMFLGLWAFIQPILMLWLFYGQSLPNAGLFYYDKLKLTVPALADVFVYILMAIVGLKLLASASVPWVLSFIGIEKFDRLTDEASQKAVQYMPGERKPAENQWQAFKNTFKDLTKPAFLIPCLLVSLFLIFSETKNAEWVWKIMRPLAVATIFFYLTNTPWMYRFSMYLRERGYFPQFFVILDQTKDNLLRKKQEAKLKQETSEEVS